MEKHKATEKRGDAIEREIDSNLKKAFDTLASEPIPDRFANLLDQLKAKGAAPIKSANRDEDDS
ncbi:NepR family anti-sigma factor [Phaeobacter sp. JH18-32]|uniref:NepR family anti-sigma factor n=1 Tax=Phaeobacter TaxID=302485 RepID=UPI003A8882C9